MAPKKKARTWTSEKLEEALLAVKNGNMGIRQAAKQFGIPFETFRKHVKGISKSIKMGCPPKLSSQCERDLTIAINCMVQMGHGVSCRQIRDLGAEVCIASGQEPFKNETPTKSWVYKFLGRHGLSLRKPENVSAARFNSETAEIKNDFFNRLEQLYSSLEGRGLTGAQIFNCDETGLCVVGKSGKIIATKGAKKVRVRTGGERGENVTVLTTANAIGSLILTPMIIFRGKTLNEDLMSGAMEGTVFALSKKSFIDRDLFEMWFERFLKSIPPVRPVVLLMDGHASHISLATILKAKENDVHILLFPPHTTHLFQPLDVSVFGPLKKAFQREAEKLMRRNKMKTLNRYHFCSILTPAWLSAVNPANVSSGFVSTGIWPFDRSKVMVPEEQAHLASSSPAAAENSSPDCSSADRTLEITPDNSPTGSIPSSVSPVVSVIKEFLKPIENVQVRSKKITHTRIITSSEFCQEMKEKELIKKQKEDEKLKKQEERRKKAEERKRKRAAGMKGKRCRQADDASQHSDKEDDPPSKSSSDESDSDSSNASEDNTLCGTCRESFQNNFKGEQWIKCLTCEEWFHNKCQNLRETDYDPKFICEDCRPLKSLLLPRI